MNSDHKRLLWKASGVYAPGFPRRSADPNTIQADRSNRAEFIAALEAATDHEMPGYYSVYSFPRGHPQDGHLPCIDTIFIDLDITGDHYDPDSGRTSFEAWRTDMSALLARARMIADAIIEEGLEDHFRVVLSGHKGVHLYFDIEPLAPPNGTIGHFKAGLAEYGQNVMAWLDDAAGGLAIERWVDVDASDLARLARHPNTVHHGAQYDDETRWCVPITVAELADLKWGDYLDYTAAPRWPDIERVPSETGTQKAAAMVRNATASSRSSSGGARKTQRAEDALAEYRDSERINPRLEVEDLMDPLIMGNKPCFQRFRERDDAYSYGQQSRTMELSIMGKFLDMGVPVEVIHEFFEPIPGYDPDVTDEMLGDLLARGNEYGEFNCETICSQSPEFCLGTGCDIYQDAPELQR